MKPAEIIDKIIEFTDHAHGDQTRKYNTDRYIVHPIRVMKLCADYTDKLPVLSAAILHDVIEDTPLTGDDISSFLSHYMDDEDQNETVKLVVELTDVYLKKNFPKMNRFTRKQLETKRLKEISADAQTIKYADIIDNAKEISQNDPSFAKRFLAECYDILIAMEKGNSELRQKAIDLVTGEIEKLRAN